MHVARISCAFFAVFVAVAVAGSMSACGQVTGLSDDYLFDLTDGGATKDGAADTATADGSSSTDAAADVQVDAANKCTVAQANNAAQKLDKYNGSMACKTCLAGSCCTDVEACSVANTDCNHVLSCKLDCTDRTGTERTSCFASCNNSGAAVPAIYTQGVGMCGAGPCATACGFQ